MKKNNFFVFYTALIILLPALFLTACLDSEANGYDPNKESFTVNFSNTGTTVVDQQIVKAGEFALEPLPPSRDGYKFFGWFTIDNNPFNFNTPITGNIIIYAGWIRVFTVTLNADGGNVTPDSIQVIRGEQAGTLPFPEKANSYFQGWFTGMSGAGTEFTSSAIVLADITIYAKWLTFAPGTNNVVFYTNGGTAVAPVLNVPLNTSITAPVSPTKEGYAFEGWYKEPDFAARWYFPVMSNNTMGDKVNGNVTLYAKWLKIGEPAESGMYSSSGISLQLHVGRATGNNAEHVNRIYNSNGKEIRLVGVAVPSLEWGRGQSVVHSTYEVFANWNANIVRLAVIPDGWLGLDTAAYGQASNYKATIDRVVDVANSFGKYIILDNHEYLAPTQKTLDFWKSAAVHYKNNPAVLFGLLNEPHTVSWDIWQNGGVHNGNTYIGHQNLVDEIRALGANNIIVAGGLEWGYRLDGIAANNFARILVDNTEGRGIIYDSHLYPWKDTKGFPTSTTRVLVMADKAPIIVGEFGIQEEGQASGGDPNRIHTVLQKPWFLEDILNWMELHGFHFTAWNFHPSSAPRMVLNDSNWTARENVTPTNFFGQQIYARLKSYPNSNSHLNPLPARPINGN